MKRPILLIDMDGTLVDTERDLAASVNHTLVSMGHPSRTLGEIRSFIGNGALAMIAKALETAEPQALEQARGRFFAHYDEHLLDHSRVFDGWDAVFASDVTLVCATNKPERFARKILDGLGLSRRFALLVGGDTLPVKKPDAGVAAHIAGALGAAVEDFVIVGDGVPDGRLAKNCRFPFWGARWGYAPEAELAPLVDVWLERPGDILRHLAGA